MSGHTPGPWRRYKMHKESEWVLDAKGGDGWYAFAKVCAFTTGRNGRKDEAEGTANANLIAAAPDLLEALEALEYQLGGETDPVRKRFADARTAARAAIAKAREEDNA